MKPECPHYISKLHDDFYCEKCEKQITMSKEDSKPDIKRYYIKAVTGFPPEMVEGRLGAYCYWREVEKELSELRKENEEAKGLIIKMKSYYYNYCTPEECNEIESFLSENK